MANMLKTITAFTDITANTLKEKNDARKRMLLAAYPLTFPEDWDQLPEEVKAERLDKVIKNL